MVFSSLPFYLDPPNNWHQQANHLGVTDETPQLRPPPPPLPPPHVDGDCGSGGTGSIRPGSMADRARLANIPQPEASLKCPRCDSTNTKFCYFNNYSLSQPRHFCKTCRRYWTRGGALRNVPVGGGCRRNKKTKNHSNSKSSVSDTSERHNNNTIAMNSSSISAVPSDVIIVSQNLPPQLNHHHHQLPFFTPFSVGNIGLSFGGIQRNTTGATNNANNGQTEMGLFQIGSNSNNSGMNGGAILSNGGAHQFPFFEPMAAASSLYPFHQNDQGVEASSSSMTSSSRVSQLSPVKMEDRNQNGLNSSKSFLGITENNNQYWNGNSWTDLSGQHSSI